MVKNRGWLYVLTVCMFILPGTVLMAQPSRLTIMHTNDIHSHLLGFGPNSEYTPLTINDDNTVGGMARLATVVKEVRAERKARGIPSLLLDGGDFMMGTGFALLRGKAELGIMDALNYDAINMGNHEFDWKPSGTYEIYSHIPQMGLDLPVVASNLIFDDEKAEDDALKGLFDQGVIKKYYIKNLSNGLKVGFFGITGKDAVDVAPFAWPVTFKDQSETAQEMVDLLKSKKVDLIICLSHSGNEEDSQLAKDAPGIDVIISAHTHEITPEPIIVGSTIIVQAGCFSEYLGVMDLEIDKGVVSLKDYNLVHINDSIQGDKATQEIVEGYMAKMSASLAKLGYGFDDTLAQSHVDLKGIHGEENILGNIVADSLLYGVNKYVYDPADPESRVAFAIESNGLIRDDLLKGKVAFCDAFRVVPLGFGLDGAVGYPMCTFYITAKEVKKALEVLASVYPGKGSDYWLNISGLRVEFRPSWPLFMRVRNIYIGDPVKGYAEKPLDTSGSNKTLYRVTVNYYVAQFIAVIGDYTYGILDIDPKDKTGNSYLDKNIHPGGLDDTRVDTDPDKPGIQELQEWECFTAYLNQFEDTNGDKIPDLPDLYTAPTGRISALPCFFGTATRR